MRKSFKVRVWLSRMINTTETKDNARKRIISYGNLALSWYSIGKFNILAKYIDALNYCLENKLITPEQVEKSNLKGRVSNAWTALDRVETCGIDYVNGAMAGDLEYGVDSGLYDIRSIEEKQRTYANSKKV